MAVTVASLVFLLFFFTVSSPPRAGGQVVASPRFPAPKEASALVGLGKEEVRTLLGPPSRIRNEPPAEVWQYREPDCVMDVYVYSVPPPAEVRYAEVRTRGAGEDNPDAEAKCLAAFLHTS